MKLLNKDELSEKLNELKDWQLVDNKLVKELKLKNFSDAIAFIVKVGIEAEKLDHHPDINLYGWNNVKIFLSTHDAGGITEKDINLAHKINQL
ncbi:4a-hydroxytetrahydrobiopterin dehydratase [Rosettibacter firmus]|uniref:4a-hydroxytetrahydrobiopterin dehydratase n=1 Tax=Rosettibacter firmus TaxID=3111522 RepID=UPI00336C193D